MIVQGSLSSYLIIRVPHNFGYFTYGSSVDVHLFLNCHLWFELFWHLYYWLVTFHQPVILHKDIRYRIVETVNTLKAWIQNKALTNLWIQQSQECPNQYKLLFHLLTISYTLLKCTGFIRKKSTLKFQLNHYCNRASSRLKGIVSCRNVLPNYSDTLIGCLHNNLAKILCILNNWMISYVVQKMVIKRNKKEKWTCL